MRVAAEWIDSEKLQTGRMEFFCSRDRALLTASLAVTGEGKDIQFLILILSSLRRKMRTSLGG